MTMMSQLMTKNVSGNMNTFPIAHESPSTTTTIASTITTTTTTTTAVAKEMNRRQTVMVARRGVSIMKSHQLSSSSRQQQQQQSQQQQQQQSLLIRRTAAKTTTATTRTITATTTTTTTTTIRPVLLRLRQLPILRRRQWWWLLTTIPKLVKILLLLLLLLLMLTVLVLSSSSSSSSSKWMVTAQATGFCHRPPIKPTTTTTTTTTPENDNDIFVIAHRGASYHIPIEHSLPSYRLGLELSANYIETDLAISSDGILFPMHSLDLTVTTNILNSSLLVVVGGGSQPSSRRQPWFSPYANRSSYWTFNFTFHELQTLLTLQQPPPPVMDAQQQQQHGSGRTNMYDNLFTIPSLDDVVHLLVDWNMNEIPKLYYKNHNNNENEEGPDASKVPNYEYDRYKAGLYLEFKNTHWIYSETGYNIVELLFNQITNRLLEDVDSDSRSGPTPPPSQQQYTWKDLLHCYERVRFDEYIVPPIIFQSFNHSDLYNFHTLWHSYQIPNFSDPTTTTNQLSTIAPEPLYVVLVDYPVCYDDTFWYVLSNDQYRSFINGIGCHKNCLLPIAMNMTLSSTSPSSTTTTSSSMLQEDLIMKEQQEHIAAMMERVTELQLVIHVWTERPELSYVTSSSTTTTSSSSSTTTATITTTGASIHTVFDEIYYLKCNVTQHVHGIFTESVDIAIRALQIPCSGSTTTTSTTTPPQQSLPSSGNNNNAICSSSSGSNLSPAVVVVISILVSFLLGVIVTDRFRGRYNGCCFPFNYSNRISTNTVTTSNSYQHATSVGTDDYDDDRFDSNNNNDGNGFKDTNVNDDDHTNGLELSVVT